MLHKFKVEPWGEGQIYARVSVDGQLVRARGYRISHNAAEVPIVEIEMCAIPDYEHEVEIKVSNKEEIAKLMDKTEFEKFCETWREIHNE